MLISVLSNFTSSARIIHTSCYSTLLWDHPSASDSASGWHCALKRVINS